MTAPTISRQDAAAMLSGAYPDLFREKVIVFGLRGFFDPPGENKRGIYDDAIGIITPVSDEYRIYNANTDPSIFRPEIAVLQDGVYKYAQGLHGRHHLDLSRLEDQKLLHALQETKRDLEPIPGRILPYYALIQSGPVTLLRDGTTTTETVKDPSRFPMINIHRGSKNTTSSEGCQTIFPDYWQDFYWKKVVPYMKKYEQVTVSYALLTKKAA